MEPCSILGQGKASPSLLVACACPSLVKKVTVPAIAAHLPGRWRIITHPPGCPSVPAVPGGHARPL